MALSFKNTITQCNKPFFNRSCINMDYAIVLFTSKDPTIICMGPQVSFQKIDNYDKISTMSWNTIDQKWQKLLLQI
jgi:hypothetical protein